MRLSVWPDEETSTEATRIAVGYPDSFISANPLREREKHARLVTHYRQRIAALGHSPVQAALMSAATVLFGQATQHNPSTGQRLGRDRAESSHLNSPDNRRLTWKGTEI